MTETTEWLGCDDDVRLFVRRWSPAERPRALVQIVHGKGEHSARYAGLADRLCAAGFEVWADDHRGHGLTADPARNPVDKGGLLGHSADRDGFLRVVKDLEMVSAHLAAARPGVPLFLLGHSWGSFLAQMYIERSAAGLAGCILSGTRGPGGPDVLAGHLIATLIAAVRGGRRFSPLVFSLAEGPYNKPFRPNRTSFDWLSRDEAAVDACAADPRCGFECSVAFYRDLTAGLREIHREESLRRIPKNLPILIFSGSADPVGEMGSSPTALVEAYRRQGIEDLDFILYPEARHETLNETNREEVMDNLLSWIEAHVAKAPFR